MGLSIEEQRDKIRADKKKQSLEIKQERKKVVKKTKPKPIRKDRDYLSEGWKKKRKKIIERDGFICMKCGSKENLVVHHKKYQRGKKLYEVTDAWLITWCKDCHDAHHEKYGEMAYVEVNANGENLRMKKSRTKKRKKKRGTRRSTRNYYKGMNSIKRTS